MELSDETRSVYDRMLATDEAVERLRAEREPDAARGCGWFRSLTLFCYGLTLIFSRHGQH